MECTMKKLITGILLFVLSMQGVAAQNNPYELDDACYPLFQRAELLVGKEGFDSVNEALLEKALEKGDTKAQTLYYVERLKNVSALKRAGKVFTPEDDAQVLQAMEDVKRVASELGYSQYYYYAYDLTQNYFYNTGRQVRTFELVKEMREDAIARGEEYGIWMGNRYLVSLYIAQNDYISAKKYIVASLEMYENTEADTIFERFTKLNDFVQGMGLGLSICRDIAQRMNARVYLDTTYTGGARFVLELPRVPDNTTMPNS